MSAAQDTRLAELTLAANNADTLEAMHQGVCRQRARMEACKACDDLEIAVFETDDRLREFFRDLKDEVA